MPIYNYECPDCGLVIERIQASSDEQVIWCPEDLKEDEECGNKGNSTLFERKIGKPNAHFKGSGYHTTDYDDAENPASK